jgi:DNA-binding response OmpR family regulator
MGATAGCHRGATGRGHGDAQETTALDPGMPFLAKPWTIAELLRRVREVLDRPDRA